MKKILAEPSWGVLIIHDTDNEEMSLQCLCGGIAMYEQRVILTPDEVEEFNAGTFDADSMVHEVCKKLPRVSGRLAPTFLPKDLTRPTK